MSILYNKFKMPEAIQLEDGKASNVYARFVVEPFERGFGHTLGNALRRMLLTSLEAPAIISFYMEGISHEYCAIEGIIEDMTTIILNLKGALLRKILTDDEENPREQKTIKGTLEVKEEELIENKQKVITLGDLIQTSDFELVNPELPIFTVTKPLKKNLFFKVMVGRGYLPSEDIKIHHRVVNEIVLDASFSPVKLVNYYVEDTRVGQNTDFDRLILEITTDGRISPKEALSISTKILMKHLVIFEEMEMRDIVFEVPTSEEDSGQDNLMQKLALGINEIELSVRSTNCLNGAMIETIGELVVIPEPKLLQFRNFGKKSLNEIKAKLYEMGLSLGMDLSRYGISQENIKEKIKKHLEEKQSKVKGAL